MEHQEFVEKMNEVAQKLGMIFESCDPERQLKRGEMKGSPANFWVSNGGWKEETRISISPSWPIDNKGLICKPYDSENLEITVDQNSSIEKIVSAIKKRFLPAYLPQYEAAINIKKGINEYEANKAINVDLLARYFAVEPNDNGNIYPQYKEEGLMPYSIKVNNETAKFELDLSIGKAIKVFDFLKSL